MSMNKKHIAHSFHRRYDMCITDICAHHISEEGSGQKNFILSKWYHQCGIGGITGGGVSDNGTMLTVDRVLFFSTV